MTKIQELEQKLNECQKELAESKKEGKWKPALGKLYWYRGDEGINLFDTWEKDEIDEWRRKNLKIFETEEECERYWRFMDTVKEKSYSFSEEEWEDDEIDKLVIYYDYTKKEFGVTCTWVCKYLGEIYFKDKESAQYIIDNFKDELMEFIF